MKYRRIKITLCLCLLSLAVSFSIKAQEQNVPERVSEFEFIDFSGKARNFSEFKGKIVLIDFWATWCKPCLADIPKLKTAYEAYRSKGFEIIGMDSETLTGDEEETPDPEFEAQSFANARRVIKTRGVTWTQANSKSAVPLAKKIFNVKQLPTKILIDAEGNIIARLKEGDNIAKAIETAFAGKPE